MPVSDSDSRVVDTICTAFERISHFWETQGTQRVLSLYLFWVYIVSLVGIQLNILGLYPDVLPTPPASHFASIHLAFSLILIMELISLIFIIPSSLSTSIGKQFEILTLILLRNAFKELTTLEEPVRISMENMDSILTILVSAGGALLVFLCLGVYRRIIRHPHFIRNDAVRKKYIASKTLIAFALLIIFTVVGLFDLAGQFLDDGEHGSFFETIYTILIFADIGIVLISQRYMASFYAVFRNSGFVMGTLLMRLSLSAPPLWSPVIGLLAAFFVLGLTWGTNRYIPENNQENSRNDHAEKRSPARGRVPGMPRRHPHSQTTPVR